ncbi:MAG: methyltransferase domain-containing protein [Bacteroidales bacterium]
MQERHSNRAQYFDELAISCEKHFIPYLNKFISIRPGMRVLEVGCGDGGNLLPFARQGCVVTGIDISERRIEDARSFFRENGAEAQLLAADIFEVDGLDGSFDVMLIHDVIEHIGKKKEFLNHVKRFLRPDGILFIGFPAWQMPFGGHQQICRSRVVSRLPFIHLLPVPLYRALLEGVGEPENCVNELIDIKRCGVTVEHFEQITKGCDYEVIERQLWLINPHYEIKFGLTPRKLPNLLSSLPYLRNFMSSSCFYILKRVN